MIDFDKRNELEMYANLDNTEISELCQILEHAAILSEYTLSKGFERAIEEEIDAQLYNFKTYSKIVTREKTQQRTYKELEWREA